MNKGFCKRLTTRVISLVILFNTVLSPVPAGAAKASGPAVCTHHQHDKDCGFTAASPCGHTHTEECRDAKGDCTHTHDAVCGYGAGAACTYDPESCENCHPKKSKAPESAKAEGEQPKTDGLLDNNLKGKSLTLAALPEEYSLGEGVALPTIKESLSPVTVGSTGADFTTLKAAADSLPTGGTIQLITDLDMGFEYYKTNAYNLVIDLNGHTLTSAGTTINFTTTNGSLTISGGTVKTTETNSYAVKGSGSTAINIEDATVAGQKYALESRGDCVITKSKISTGEADGHTILQNYYSLTLSGSVVEATGSNGIAFNLTNSPTLKIKDNSAVLAAGESFRVSGQKFEITAADCLILGGTKELAANVIAGNQVLGTFTASGIGDIDIPSDTSLLIPAGAHLMIPDGVTLKNSSEYSSLKVVGKATIQSGGTIDCSLGNLEGKGNITVETGGTLLPPKAKPVAQIGEQTYPSLQEAIDAVQDGGVIKLLSKQMENVTIKDTKTGSFTIDLNGFELFHEVGNTITNLGKGVLTITSSVSGGVVSATSGKAIFNNSATGGLVIKDGTISATSGTAIHNYGAGSVTVESGTVRATGTSGMAIHNEGRGAVTVKDGLVSACNTMDFKGGTIWNTGAGKIIVEGGIVTSDPSSPNTSSRYSAISNRSSGQVIVKGGEVRTDKTPKGKAIYNHGSEGAGSITVSGGIVSAAHTTEGTAIFNNGSQGIVNIFGGTLLGGRAVIENTRSTINITGGSLQSTKDVLKSTAGTINIGGGMLYGDMRPKAGIVEIKDCVLFGNWYDDTTLNTEKSNRVFGTVTMAEAFTIPQEKSLSIPDGTRLNMSAGKTLTVLGTLRILAGGVVSCKGMLVPDGTISKKETGKLYVATTVDSGQTKMYDGKTTFTGVKVIPQVKGLTAIATASGTSAGANVGTDHVFTATAAEWNDPSLAGNYDLAADNVSGTVAITAKPLTDSMIAEIPPQIYIDKPVEPVLQVTDGSPSILGEDDYTVSYSGNTAAGTKTAKATITAKQGGNYSGSASKSFVIKDNAALEIIFDKPDGKYTYGDFIEMEVEVVVPAGKARSADVNTVDFFYGDKKLNSDSIPLTIHNGTGTATFIYDTKRKDIPFGENLIMTAEYGGNTFINGKVSTAEFSLAGLTPKLTWENDEQTLVYTGKPADVTAPVANGTDTEEPGGTISYSYGEGTVGLPVNAGTYKVKAHIAAEGNYGEGTSEELTLTITPAALTVTTGKVQAKEYDGNTDAIVSELSFSGLQNGETLAFNTDYTTGNASFADASVGAEKTVTGTAALVDNAKTRNYTLNGAYSLRGEITPKALTSPRSAPSTGDNRPIGAWLALGIVSLAAIVGLKRKSRKQRK